MSALANPAASSRRISQLDEVRALLVFGVVIFHAIRVFDPFDFYVKSSHVVGALGVLILFVGLWGMPLFFGMAGHAIWHSLATRSPARYVAERTTRLLVPFLVGLVVLVPPQIHAMHAAEPGPDPSLSTSLSAFWHVHLALRFPIPVTGPDFESAHLWFLAYLFAFSLVLLPLFGCWRRPAVRARLHARLASTGGWWQVAAVAAPFALPDGGGGTQGTRGRSG